jgi:hypothetical protein
MLRYSFVFLAGLVVSGPALAGTWGEGLFDELNKDFGSVPHGQVLTHSFVIKNTTGQTLTISGVRPSCMVCTSAYAVKSQLAPGEETTLSVRMDSGKFFGVKTVWIYVTLSGSQYEEVKLWIQANSRDDINLTPDTIAFGLIHRGDGPSKSISITFFGNVPSDITEVQAESNYVQPKIGPARRNGSEVTYELTVKLRPDTPVGKWFTDVWVKTSNPSLPKVRVPLTVSIDPAITVNTTILTLGEVKVGQSVERKLVVRGVKPFKITDIKGTDGVIEVKNNSTESREQHVLTVRLKGDKPGAIDRALKVITDIKDEGEVEFHAKGQVVP